MHLSSEDNQPGIVVLRLLFYGYLLPGFALLLLAGLTPRPATFNVLVFSKTGGFRHASITDGLAAVRALATEHGFSVEATEDAGMFTDGDLAAYQLVLFLNTTGDVLNTDQQAAFERFIRSGNGFVGVHAAADTEYDWPWYGGLVGAYFESHPAIQTGTLKVADQAHPSTAMLPKRWVRTDEWYSFRHNPRGDVHVLATLDETTYQGGTMGHDHPIAWCHDYDGGRAWYTAGGHTAESYSEPLYREHLLQGITYAAGRAPGDCGATVNERFEKVVLDANTENPMDLAVAPDGRVFFIERAGEVRLYQPDTRTTTTAGRLNVETSNEDGLLGIVLDPDFAANGSLYLFYSPAGSEPKQHVSRFTVVGDALDTASEQLLLEIPVQRDQCCHSAGSMAFDANGNLFIATGDNTNPFESDGFAPIDERPGRAPWDAQKSSGNTHDLRGKILRITPQPDGTYTIPDGNLFPRDGSGGAPEVYVMGLRNPFRIAVDSETGWLYWGDVGPDAGEASSTRGPAGLDEWNQARAAGNYGWPYCIGDNQPYLDYDFATGTSGALFNCAAPTNNSPNNTGATTLPPARPAWIWYPYGPSTVFPILTGGGRTAMGGPIYHYDAALASETKLPAYYDDAVFIFEWSRNWIREVKLDDAGDVLTINPFAPHLTLQRPMAMKIGPKGAIYMLEWGSGFGGNNDDSQLIRIDYVRGTRAPVAVITATPTSGPVPLTVQFSSDGTFDPDPGDALRFAWDLDGDGATDTMDPNPAHTYTAAGTFTVHLTVSDAEDNTATASLTIIAGNTQPTVTLNTPVEGGFFDWGDLVPFAFTVSDAEDGATENGSLDCSSVTFQPFVGHDDHSHPLNQFNACDGTFQVIDAHGSDSDNLFYVVEVSYTDRGANGAGALTTRTQHVLRPKRLQAEHFTTNNGIQLEATGDVLGGGQNVGFVEHGDHVSFATINLHNIGFVTYRVASAGPGGRIEMRVDAPDGPLISTAHVEPTGAWQVYRDVTAAIADPGGTHDLFFVFQNNPGDGGLFNVNWMDFHGPGIALNGEAQHGLRASYFDDLNFTGRSIEQVDAQINFNWASDGPLAGIGDDTFSVRWTGFIEPEHTEAYTFYTRTDDGIRLWIDGQLRIDQWFDQAVTEVASQPILLEAQRSYPIQVEYFENAGLAQAHLFWSSPSTPKAILPSQALTPDGLVTATEPEAPTARLSLASIYPNPVPQTGTIRFTLAEAEPVTLELFDLLGRRVTLLLDEIRSAGTHQVILTTDQLASGTYLCRLTTPSTSTTRTFVVLR